MQESANENYYKAVQKKKVAQPLKGESFSKIALRNFPYSLPGKTPLAKSVNTSNFTSSFHSSQKSSATKQRESELK